MGHIIPTHMAIVIKPSNRKKIAILSVVKIDKESVGDIYLHPYDPAGSPSIVSVGEFMKCYMTNEDALSGEFFIDVVKR